jgi:hypothetical protein
VAIFGCHRKDVTAKTFTEDNMTTAPIPSRIDLAYVSELLEVAFSILQRHHDRDLAQKTIAMQKYLEMRKRYPNRDSGEAMNKALRDLTAAVHTQLNSELEAVAQLLGRLP